MKWNRISISFLVFFVSLLLFVPFLGGSYLFDWDEVNFAEAAREMLVTGEFSYIQINFKPFWEKPPLFIWIQALSMNLFGVNEFAARLPNAICGAVSLTLLFNIGQRLISTSFGLLWVLVYAGSLLPQFYFRSGIIDPWFNLFIFSGVHFLVKATSTENLNRWHLLISAFLIGLAVMTKGPTALVLVGICAAVYFMLSFKNHSWRLLDPLLYLSTVLLVGFSYFLVEIARGRGYIVQEFIDYHIRLLSESEAGHGQPFYYHPIVLLVGCFPMSLFFIFAWKRNATDDSNQKHYKKWMSILFWVVLIVFSIVKTKIVHYSSLAYFPMSFLAAHYLFQKMNADARLKGWQAAVIAFFVLILGIAIVLLGSLERFKAQLLEFLSNDPLAHGNFSQNIPDQWFEPLIGVGFILFGFISIYWMRMGNMKRGAISLFGLNLIMVLILSSVFVPKIDRYQQKPLFDFYKEKSSEVYFKPIAFHSYAHLFYGKRTPLPIETDDELKWMVYEKVDKPVYFVCRDQDLEASLNYFPHLQEIDRKGGYVILVRTDKRYPFLGLP